MNLHEYQAKQLFAEYGVPVLKGAAVKTVAEAEAAAKTLGGNGWVIKAQVHAGGRGKAGGVKLVKSVDELKAAAQKYLGSRLVTHQTDAKGLPINTVLIESLCDIAKELYVSLMVDRSSERVVIMASAMGGMDIEEVAAKQPEALIKIVVDPVVGLMPYQCRQISFGMGLPVELAGPMTKLLTGLYKMFIEKDCSLVEINPLVITKAGELLALDAKVGIDGSALYRQKSVAAMQDASQEDPTEHEAEQHGLNYVTLDGNIGCMVNGAGLAMATMDLIKLHGGMPANFLDVGGGTTAEKVAEAFKLILADKKVKAVLVNIFGGIVRCNLIAEGIISAVKEVGVTIPVVVRLEGTNAQQGRELLDNSGLAIASALDLTDAAQKVVAASKGGK
ncbi:MAG: ADP-forming succinate--CoA ligase subunit beta [Gammaproteobacteria bacterium]|nr:ADP-forming succinate--CoA ligase subunit beta [Gammaproteobacteria bacterium]